MGRGIRGLTPPARRGSGGAESFPNAPAAGGEGGMGNKAERGPAPGGVAELLRLAWPLIVTNSFWALADLRGPRSARPGRRRSGRGRPGDRHPVLDADESSSRTRPTTRPPSSPSTPAPAGRGASARSSGSRSISAWSAASLFLALAPAAETLLALGRPFAAPARAGSAYFRCLCFAARRRCWPPVGLSFFAGRGDSRTVLARQRRRARRQRRLRLGADLRPVRLPPPGHRRRRLGHRGRQLHVGAAVAGPAVPPPPSGRIRHAGGLAFRPRPVRPADALRPAQRPRRRPRHARLRAVHAARRPHGRRRAGRHQHRLRAQPAGLPAACSGIGQAVEILVGRRLGENDPATAARSTCTALGLRPALTGVAAAAFVFFPGPMAELFHGDDARWDQVRSLAPVLLRFVAVYCLFDATSLVFSCALRGAGDTRFVTVVALAVSWLVLVLPTWAAWATAGGCSGRGPSRAPTSCCWRWCFSCASGRGRGGRCASSSRNWRGENEGSWWRSENAAGSLALARPERRDLFPPWQPAVVLAPKRGTAISKRKGNAAEPEPRHGGRTDAPANGTPSCSIPSVGRAAYSPPPSLPPTRRQPSRSATRRRGDGRDWAVAETANFRIFHNQSREVAEKAARLAEAARSAAREEVVRRRRPRLGTALRRLPVRQRRRLQPGDGPAATDGGALDGPLQRRRRRVAPHRRALRRRQRLHRRPAARDDARRPGRPLRRPAPAALGGRGHGRAVRAARPHRPAPAQPATAPAPTATCSRWPS